MSEEKEVDLVYLGVTVTFNGAPKKYYAYIEPNRVEGYLAGTDEAKYYKRMLSRVSVGAVIKCAVIADGDLFTIRGEPKFSYMMNFKISLLLEAKSAAAVTQYETEVERRKASNESTMEKQLAPVKETYSHMKASERRAFMAWLLVYLNA